MKKILNFFLISLYFCQAYAADPMPASCHSLLIKEDAITLTTAKKPLLFMIYNTSKKDLWLAHPSNKAGANAGWTSRLQPGNGSALLLNRPKFALTCIESQPGHEQQIPCAEAVTVCQWTFSKSSKAEISTYWAGENMEMPALVHHLQQRGFILPVKNGKL